MPSVLADNGDACGQEIVGDRPRGQNLGAILTALADEMGETIGRLEEIAARISQIVLANGGGATRDLIVELQGFDRLQQEFSAFARSLLRCAEAAYELPWSGEHDARLRSEVVMAISVAELRGRVLRRFAEEALASSPEDEAVF